MISSYLFLGRKCANLTIANTNADNVFGEFETTFAVECVTGFAQEGSDNNIETWTAQCNASALWDNTVPCERE